MLVTRINGIKSRVIFDEVRWEEKKAFPCNKKESPYKVPAQAPTKTE